MAKSIVTLCLNIRIAEKPFEKGSYPLSKGKLKNLNSYFFIFGAISSTTVKRKYTPYSNQVIISFQGKLFFGWFNENITNTIATIYIITPMILDMLFFM